MFAGRIGAAEILDDIAAYDQAVVAVEEEIPPRCG